MADTDQCHARRNHERGTGQEEVSLVVLLELEMEVERLQADPEESVNSERPVCTARTIAPDR
jgi:hypothetical protein